jgi:hypothetical protein
MDIRQLLNKLDRVALSEAISLKDVEAAVAGIKDEQQRAAKLNDLAWDNKLPGLYDPVSGNFVRKQGQPDSMGGSYSISATAPTSADKELSNWGLIPQNAKTSTSLGRMVRGDDEGKYDKELKGKSDTLVKQQEYDKKMGELQPKLKTLADLVKKLQSVAGITSASNATASTTSSPNMGQINKESSIFESLMTEFRDEVGNDYIAEALSPEAKSIVDEINAILAELEPFGDVAEFEQAINDAKKVISDAEKAGAQDAELDAASAEADKVAADTQAKADAGKKAAAGTAGAGGANQVQQVQQQLLDAGFTAVGKADGKMGPMTAAAIKQFQQMAGINADGKIGPELLEKLKNAKQIASQNRLTTSLAAVEKIIAKYKIAESITSIEDLELLSEDELRKYVLTNIKVFSESEQMSIMKEMLAERSVTGSVDLPANFGKAPTDSRGNPVRPGYMGSPTAATTPGAAPAAAPAGAPAAKAGGWMDKAKSAFNRASTAVKGAANKIGTKGKIGLGIAAGVAIAAAAPAALSKLKSWLSGADAQLDPADKAELVKHLDVITTYAKDETAVKALPQDVQTRLTAILTKADKLSNVQAKAAPAGAAAGAAAGGLAPSSMPVAP